MKLNALKFGYAGAIWAALFMVLLSVLAALGLYTGAAEQMQNWHMFYDTGFVGTIAGAVEATILSFIGFYVFAWIYNSLLK